MYAVYVSPRDEGGRTGPRRIQSQEYILRIDALNDLLKQIEYLRKDYGCNVEENGEENYIVTSGQNIFDYCVSSTDWKL